MLGLMWNVSSAQAQSNVPAPGSSVGPGLVMVDDQIVPAASIVRGKSRGDLETFSLFPNVRKWTDGLVYYTYNDNMSAAKRAIFEAACREWEQYANLRFIPRAGQPNYIIVTSTENVSNSRIGMTGGGQVMNLADWANKLTAMHELAHALGVIHEQSRPDRDTFVTIRPENIEDSLEFNFAKIGGALNQTDYDFESMMHYSRKAFSINGQDTITTNAGYTQFQNVMGQRSRASGGDKSGMARIYGEPVVSGEALTPKFPKTKDKLTATPTGAAAGASADSYSYVWRKNGVVIPREITNTLDLSVEGNGDKGDRITVQITGPDADGVVGTEEAAVTVVNSAPVTPARQFSTDNTRTVEEKLAGTDDDNDSLTFTVVTNAERGALTLSREGAFSYKPAPDYVGTDGFKVAANDGQTSSLPATISINIVRGNQPPVLANSNLRATINLPFNTQLDGTDADGDTLNYFVRRGSLPDGINLSSDGTLFGRPTKLQTTEATVFVTDGNGGTTEAKLIIEVRNDDRAPIVSATIAPTTPRTKDTVTVTATISNPTGGAVTTVYNFLVNGKSVQSGSSNTLDLSVAGQGDKGETVSCEVTATNEGGGKGVGKASVKVLNSAPFARSGTGSAEANVLKAFDLGGFDADNETLKINIVGKPANGVAEVGPDKDGVIRLFYRSRAGYRGTDVIRFTVSDSDVTSTNVSTFAIGVRNTAPPENRAPVAGDTTINTFVGESVTKGLLGSDPDGDALTFRVINNARYGKSEIKRDTDGLWKLFYTSLNRFFDSDRVTYIAIDSKGKPSNVATITINFGNRAPVAKGNRISVASGEPVSQPLFADDPDNDAVRFRLVNNPRYGKGEIKRDEQGAWRVYYQSLKGYVGPDRINFIAIDAAGKQSEPATIEISVIRVTETPSAGAALQSGTDAPSGGGA